jgi:hypothetical protein
MTKTIIQAMSTFSLTFCPPTELKMKVIRIYSIAFFLVLIWTSVNRKYNIHTRIFPDRGPVKRACALRVSPTSQKSVHLFRLTTRLQKSHCVYIKIYIFYCYLASGSQRLKTQIGPRAPLISSKCDDYCFWNSSVKSSYKRPRLGNESFPCNACHDPTLINKGDELNFTRLF